MVRLLLPLLLAFAGDFRCGAQDSSQDGSTTVGSFDLLPLEVVAAIPSTLLASDSAPVEIQDAAALQVVFSQPIIRLGADFSSESINAPFTVEFIDGSPLLGEGLLQRWVTTFIWRIDPPDLGWPTDADLTLTWNPTLTTWTGAELVTDVEDRSLRTPGLRMNLRSVESEGAGNATDGRWNANWRGDPLEVPPDGIARLQFTGSLVNPTSLANARITTNGAASDVKVFPVVCPLQISFFGAPRVNQVCVEFEGLVPNRQYTFTLPSGTRYNDLAGPLREALTFTFRSRLPFTIPLSDSARITANNYNQAQFQGVSSTALRLVLYHGIAAEPANRDIASRVTIVSMGPAFEEGNSGTSTPVDYNFTISNRAYANLMAPLLPTHKYRLDITPGNDASPGVRSAPFFGSQPLTTLEAGKPDTVSFTTQRLRDRVEYPQTRRNMRLKAVGAGFEIPVLLQKDPSDPERKTDTVVAVPVLAASAGPAAFTVGELVQRMAVSRSGGSLAGKAGAQSIALQAQQITFNNLFAAQGLAASTLLSPTGLGFVHTEKRGSRGVSFFSNEELVSTGDVTLGIVTGADSLTAWAVSAIDGTPVAGVEITAYAYRFSEAPIVQAAVTTDAQGVAKVNFVFPDDRSYPNVFVSGLTPAGQLVLVESNLQPSFDETSSTLTRLLVDRTVVAPGHLLHAWGYLRTEAGGTVTVPAAPPQARLRLCSAGECTGANAAVVEVDSEFGSFDGTILLTDAVIDLLGFGDGFLSLETCSSNCGSEAGWRTVDTVSITISDPRPPTAELLLTVPSFAPPNSTITLTGSTVSLLGSNVVGAEVDIQWQAEDVQGSLIGTAGANGNFTVELDLSEVAPLLDVGSSVSFDAVWIGPTRERLTASGSTSVQFSPFKVSLTLGVDAMGLTPGRTFGIVASVDGPSGPPQQSVEVVAVPITRALCESISSCQESRFDDDDDGDGFAGYYDYGFRSFRPPSAPSSALKPAEQQALLAAGQPVCSALPAAGGSWSDCSWALPGFGIFALVACVPTGQGTQRECAISYAGKRLAEWEGDPLDTAPEAAWRWAVPSGADGFEVGAQASIEIDSPVAGARALLVWASSSDDGILSVPSLTAGINTASIAVPASCALGCTADVLVSWPSSTLPADLPVATVLDVSAPVIQDATSAGGSRWPVDVKQPVLQPQVTLGGAAAGAAQELVVEPLSNFTLTLDLSACTTSAAASCGNALADAAEVVVVAVDKAWLLLQPYELPDPAALFDVSLSPQLSTSTSTQGSVNPAAITRWRQANSEVLDLNPWARLLGLSNLDTPPAEWLENQVFDLDDGFYGAYYEVYQFDDAVAFNSAPRSAPLSSPDSAGFLLARSAAAEGSVDGDGPGAGGGGGAVAAPQAPRLISPLDTTPIFRIARLTPGAPTQQLQVTAPAALTTYVVRAFAASASGDVFGSEETELIVRRVVSLTPSAPRIIRTGDNGTAGVVVTFSGTATAAAPVTVTVTVAASGPVQLTGPAEASLVFDGSSTQQETRFDLTAVTTGDVQLTFSAEAAAGRDALQVELPSLLTQPPVVVATSFAVTPGQGVQEGLDIPAAISGTGTVSVVAGVGNLPAQLAMTQRLLSSVPRAPVTAPWPVAVMALYTVLNQYGDAALDAPLSLQESAAEVLGVAENTTVCTALSAAVDYALDSFAGLTAIPRLGLMYYPVRAFRGWTEPEEPNISLILASRLAFVWAGRFGAPPAEGRCGAGAGVQAIFADSVDWLARAQGQLFLDAVESRALPRSLPYSALSLVATLWAVRGPMFDLGAALESANLGSAAGATAAIVTQVADDLSLARLIREVPNLSSFSTGLISLVLSDAATGGGPGVPANASAVVLAIQTRHTDRFRITARTAYIATSPSSPTPASTASQAAVILSALAAGNRTSVTEKHANFIASRQGGTSPYFVSSRSVVQSMLALLEYDNVSGSTLPNLRLVVQSAPTQILQATFSAQQNTVVESSVSFDDLATPPAPLTFVANGTGEASLAASLNFVPAQLPTTPAFRGLQVDLAIRNLNATTRQPTGPLLSVAPLGATLHVLVQVATPDDLQETTVRVLLPGGLEPIDRNLDEFGNTAVCPLPFFLSFFTSSGSRSRFGFASFFWFPTCPRVETTPESVTFFLDRLSPGTHEYSFLAIAASPGQYTVPPAIAFDDNQPEVTGLSAGQKFTVCRSDTCTAAESAAGQSQQRLPLDCPNSCSGAGLCDTGTGECVCDPGFAGIDCAMLTV